VARQHVKRRWAEQDYQNIRQTSADPERAGRRCHACVYFGEVFRPRCHLGDFPAKAMASCSRWEERPGPPPYRQTAAGFDAGDDFPAPDASP
jgi:hypothetical protein